MRPLLNALFTPFQPVREKPKSIVSFNLMRGAALFFMICIHVLQTYGNQAVQNSMFGTVIMLLGSLPAAPVFMLLMGFFMICTPHRPLRVRVRRGLLIFLAGYGLNALRFGLPVGLAILGGAQNLDLGEYTFLELFLIVDILPFAGAAYIILSLVQHYFRRPIYWLVLMVILIFGAIPLRLITPVSEFGRYLGNFIWGIDHVGDFPFFPWAAVPLAGMLLGILYINRKSDTSFFRTFHISGLALVLFGVAGYLLFDGEILTYSRLRITEVFMAIGWVGLWHLPFYLWAGKRHKKDLLANLMIFGSRNLTIAYFLHWTLIGWGVLLIEMNSFTVVPVILLMHLFSVLTLVPVALWRRRKAPLISR